MKAKLFNETLAKSMADPPTQEEPAKSTENTQTFNIKKTDDDKRLIFGWASVAITKSGEQVVDHQNDIIDPENLEEVVYKYVLEFRDGGEEHIPNLRKKARMVESCMFTKEKMEAMGIPEGVVPEGWWIGFYVDDDEAWKKVKNGTYRMFSVEGKGVREEVDEDDDEFEKSERINGCGVLVVKDGKILTATRIDGKHKNQIGGPGGHIDRGEEPEEAAIREAKEEFGIECKNLKPLGIQDGGRAYGKSAVFLCTEYDGEPETDEEEMTDCKWRTIEELREEKLFWPFEQSLALLKKSPQKRPTVAKTFDEILKINPHHDARGRFAPAPGGAAASRTAPRTMSSKDFDDYVEKNGLKRLYRGYSAKTPELLNDYEKDIQTGTSASSGEKTSALGKGVYFSGDPIEAEGYMNRRKQENGDEYGRVTTAALDVGAKIADHNEYQLMKFEEESALNAKAIDELINGAGKEAGRKIADQAMAIRQLSVPEYAAAKGIDALYDDATGYTVVMNQKALVVKVDSVAKSETIAQTFDEILKFNPFHDERGRFANANGYATFTMATKDPKKQHWADKAIARMKQQAAQAAPPKPQKNYDKLGYADHDDADYHQLYNGKQYYAQQKLTAVQQKAVSNYLEATTEPGSLYSHSQNMNYKMATGQALTGKYKQTHDGLMSAMHNLGYNVELTRYDHDGMVSGLLGALGAKGTVDTLSISQLKKALVGSTMNEDKFLSVSYNDFKNAPASSTNVFTNRRVKITYKAKASTQAMMPGDGPGGSLGELILAPTNGKSNPGGKITDVKLTGKKARNQGTQILNKQQIEIIVEI